VDIKGKAFVRLQRVSSRKLDYCYPAWLEIFFDVFFENWGISIRLMVDVKQPF
jgi:hypothetical protein